MGNWATKGKPVVEAVTCLCPKHSKVLQIVRMLTDEQEFKRKSELLQQTLRNIYIEVIPVKILEMIADFAVSECCLFLHRIHQK